MELDLVEIKKEDFNTKVDNLKLTLCDVKVLYNLVINEIERIDEDSEERDEIKHCYEVILEELGKNI